MSVEPPHPVVRRSPAMRPHSIRALGSPELLRRAPHPMAAGALGLAAGALLAVAPSVKRAGADAPTIGMIGVESIKPGMKGYGLTVFIGTEPERFEVEVIGVLKKFRPSQHLILVKTQHPRLEKVKVVAGMSGSPIFLQDGAGPAKLAGAYAYGWPFGNEPVAGVTPIGSMLPELGRPLSPMLLPRAGKPPIGAIASTSAEGTRPGASGHSATEWSGAPGAYSLEAHVAQVAGRLRPGGASPGVSTPTPVDTPLIVGGMSDRAVRALGQLVAPLGLVPLQAGGAGSPAAKGAPGAGASPEHYVDGGAIAVQLMRGDTSAQGTGTVTHVIGRKLVGFGHPMMELGASHLPTAIAKVLWVLSSDQRSFKISEPVRDLGTMTQDRESCIVADETIAPPMVPVTIDILGEPTAPKKKWAMDIVHDRMLTPMWASFAFGDAVGVAINDHRDVSWVITSTLKVRGKGELRIEDYGVSGVGVPGSLAFFGSRAGVAIGELMNNPWEPVVIERIDSKIAVTWSRDTVRLRGAELLDNPVDAGGTARVKLVLKPYYGDEYTVVTSIRIDPSLAGREVELEVIPGWQATPDVAPPENLDQLIHNLTVPTRPLKSFVVQYRHPEPSVAMNGRVAARLPGFAVDALKASSSTVVPDSFAAMARRSVDIGGYPEGTTKVRVNVRVAVR